MPSEVGLSGLPIDVEARIRAEVPDRGERILAALTTAAWFLNGAAERDEPTLRLAESAAYNLREAIDGVAKGRSAAEGGLRAIHDAWTTLELAAPGTDEEAEARAGLDDVLRQVMSDHERGSQRSRQILAYLRAQAGAEPLGGQLDPVIQYKKLLDAANGGTHDSCTPAAALDLLDRTRNWFIHMFTTPDDQVRAVIDLAIAPYAGPDQLNQLADTVASPHHLRLFFGRLLDPAWLVALCEADLVPLPTEDGLWPVAAVTDGLARTHPGEVADLLQRLLARTAPCCSRIGPRPTSRSCGWPPTWDGMDTVSLPRC